MDILVLLNYLGLNALPIIALALSVTVPILLNFLKHVCEILQVVTGHVESMPCWRTADFRRNVECQYGLLDYLRENFCLTAEDLYDLKEPHSTWCKRKLTELINSTNVDKFLQGLEKSNQRHLVNFITNNGKRNLPEDDDWPVSDSDIAPIIKSYSLLVESIHYQSVVDELFAKSCLNFEQKSDILANSSTRKANRELLEIVMRRSVRQLNIFYDCLKADHREIWHELSQSQEKQLFGVDSEKVTTDSPEDILKNIIGKKEDICRAADDLAIQLDIISVKDNVYFAVKQDSDLNTSNEIDESHLECKDTLPAVRDIINRALQRGDNAVNIIRIADFSRGFAFGGPEVSNNSLVLQLDSNTSHAVGMYGPESLTYRDVVHDHPIRNRSIDPAMRLYVRPDGQTDGNDPELIEDQEYQDSPDGKTNKPVITIPASEGDVTDGRLTGNIAISQSPEENAVRLASKTRETCLPGRIEQKCHKKDVKSVSKNCQTTSMCTISTDFQSVSFISAGAKPQIIPTTAASQKRRANDANSDNKAIEVSQRFQSNTEKRDFSNCPTALVSKVSKVAAFKVAIACSQNCSDGRDSRWRQDSTEKLVSKEYRTISVSEVSTTCEGTTVSSAGTYKQSNSYSAFRKHKDATPFSVRGNVRVTSEDCRSMPCGLSGLIKTTFSQDYQIKTILHNIRCTGVTVVGSEIFVTRVTQPHVEVYDSRSLTASRSIDVPAMKLSRHLAGCGNHKALYISDGELKSIHRVDIISNSVTRWNLKANRDPRSISVTAACTLLVTVRFNSGECGVVEYTSYGKLLREIKFDRSIIDAWHTIQMSREYLLVSHGEFKTSLHRLCVISSEGEMIDSYGNEMGTGIGRLDEPRALARDYSHNRIFVADRCNDRILLLDTGLNYLGQVNTPKDLRCPSCLHFDQTRRLLYIGEESGRLLVITPLLRTDFKVNATS